MTTERSCRDAIDQAHASLLAGLPPELVTIAERLARRLRLTTRGNVGWGEVFDDVAMLGLPTLVLNETFRKVDAPIRECAQRAHLFAMLAVRINAGIDNGALESDPELDAVLGALERERNRALAELRLLGADRRLNASLPEREVRAALAEQHELLAGRSEASFADYVAISTAKQSLAFLALTAAADAAGFEFDELGHIHELTLGTMLGMQIRDDVATWLANPSKRGAWVPALSEHGPSQLEVVLEMIELARDAFCQAADSARAIGARSLLIWARAEANALRELSRLAERQLPNAGAPASASTSSARLSGVYPVARPLAPA